MNQQTRESDRDILTVFVVIQAGFMGFAVGLGWLWLMYVAWFFVLIAVLVFNQLHPKETRR